MEDPVFDVIFNSVSFERKAIMHVLKQKKGKAYCPVSGFPLTADSLVSNTKLQWMIRYWKKQQKKNQNKINPQQQQYDVQSDVTVATIQDAIDSIDSSDVPKHLICPLSGKMMNQPVTTKYGYNFEKSNLVNWLCKNGNICPISYQPLEMRQVVPNITLRMELRKFLSDNGIDVVDNEEDVPTVAYYSDYQGQVKNDDAVTTTASGKNNNKNLNFGNKMNALKVAMRSLKIGSGTAMIPSNPAA